MSPEHSRFAPEDFFSIQELQEWGVKSLLELEEEMGSYLNIVLRNYKYGTRFMHAEAYELCCAGIMWPEFLYDPERSNYVLAFHSLNTLENQDLRFAFEDWFNLNRGEIAERAAEALGKEIETI